MKERIRIDRLLVEIKLAESREKAQAMVMAGEVLTDGQKVTKAGQKIAPDAEIRLLGKKLKYVSRGGIKLEAALEQFAINVAEKICLDVGSSTGGFTDCLLQQGAKKVYAVDVGTAQLHWNLRQDPRVEVHENVNARYLSKEVVPEEIDVVCCDVSFISVTRILPALLPLLKQDTKIVVLVKPQFEVGKGEVGKGGIVRDPQKHREAVEKVCGTIAEIGFCQLEKMESPILGAKGNKEFFLYASQWVSLP